MGENYVNGMKTVGDLKKNIKELVGFAGSDPVSFVIDNGNTAISFDAMIGDQGYVVTAENYRFSTSFDAVLPDIAHIRYDIEGMATIPLIDIMSDSVVGSVSVTEPFQIIRRE